MKKIVSLLITLLLAFFMLSSCTFGESDSNEGTNNNVSKIKIGCLSGPTGMGMAKLISDNGMDSEKYSFTVFSSPDDARNAFLAGDVDAICFPTNTALNLYNKTNGSITVAAVNCLGSLYVISNSTVDINGIEDLEGKTIYASVPNSTTLPIVEHILDESGINANITFEYNNETLATHDQLVALVAKGLIDIAILPEPKATATILSNAALGLSIDINLSEAWESISDDDEPLTMGCIIFNKQFAIDNKSSVDAFLSEYEESIKYINDENNNESSANMIAESGILPNANIAKKALNNLYGSIVYIDGKEMKTALDGFFTVIDMELPDDEFFYEG